MTNLQPTSEQKTVIDYEKSLVVIARPGSGKTFVVSEKVRQILPNLPEYRGIIAISYTRKASNELKRRCNRNGIEAKYSFFGTIDRFCDSEIIMPFLPQLWGKPAEEVMIERIRDLSKTEQEQFKFVKENQVSLSDLENQLALIKKYFLQGTLLLEVNGALALYVLKNSTACKKYIAARYSHVFIDEYQDSGLEQHRLFLEMHKLGLTAVAVGDVDQSIFGFSGKSSRFLVELSQNDLFKTFSLNYNHRCQSSIINYSLCLLDEHAEALATQRVQVYSKEVQGTQKDIVVWIEKKLPKIKAHFQVGKNSEIGILVRSNHSGLLVDQSLNIAHRFFRSTSLEEHFSLWAKLFCELLYYRFNSQNTSEEVIQEFSRGTLQRSELRCIRSKIKAIRESHAEQLRTQCIEIANVLLPKAENVKAVELLTSTINSPELLESFKPACDTEIQVMTLHKAKGLEFDVVFHLDLYEWVFPSKGPGPHNDWNNLIFSDWEQDLNLHYVGITRARKVCILCTSTKRINSSNEIKRGVPSEFLSLPGLCGLRVELR